MKRILFVFPHLRQGGAQIVATTIANALIKKGGYEIGFFSIDEYFFCQTPPSPLINHYYLPKTNLYFGKSFYKLCVGLVHHLKTQRYDYIVSGCEGTSEISLFLLRFFHKRLCLKMLFVSMIHTPISKVYQVSSISHKIGWQLLKWARQLTFDCVTVVSKSLFDDPFLSGIKNKMVIRNPIDHDMLQKLAREPLSEEQTKHINEPFFLCVGRISREKNPMMVLEGFNLVKNNCRHNLILLGTINDTLLFDEMQKYIAKNLEGRVFYMGVVTNPYVYMQKADALVSTSHYESFLLVAFEAMALGCVVISTKFDGYERLFTNEHALLVSRHNANELASALKRVITKDPSLSQMRINANEMTQSYTLPLIVEQYHSLFSGE
jgi:glycosyltransferase involved in cell wall biosynthesis